MPQRRIIPKKSRKQETEVIQRVKERCFLPKSWRKAKDQEKGGLRNLESGQKDQETQKQENRNRKQELLLGPLQVCPRPPGEEKVQGTADYRA